MHSGLIQYAVLCAGALYLSVGSALAGLPTDYNTGFVPHRVTIPKLQLSDQVETDLTQSPWNRAAQLTGNLDWRRIRTADLPVWTSLFYDEQAMWVAYRCEVTPGPKFKAEHRERDADLKGDDTVTLEFDVGPTGRVFYRFVINSAGTLCDSVIIDKSWNSTATIRTHTDDKGWTAVVRIPFSDFKVAAPTTGSASWTFNVSTRSGTDNSWAPVLGGYHTPEQFAIIHFGDEATQPARMLNFKPVRAGVNTFHVQAAPGTRFIAEAIDRNNRMATRQHGPIGDDGQIRYELRSDNIDHVNFTLEDPDGNPLLTFWRPAEIPPLLSRLPALREKLTLVQSHLDRFPPDTRENIARLIADTQGFLAATPASLYTEWNTLSEKLMALERPLTDAWLYAQTLEQLSPQAQFALALAGPMDKVMIKDFPCPGRVTERYPLALARNEHEAMQVVVIPMSGPLKNLKIAATPALGSNNQGTLNGSVRVSLVGHVQTKPAGTYLPDYVGWHPDPILDFQQTCDAALGEHIAFWIDVSTNADARPGDYVSTLEISAADCPAVQLPLHIHVWDIDLGKGTHLRNAFTYTDSYAKRLYPGRWNDQLAKKFHDFILDHRLNIDSLYGKHDRNPELMRYGADRGMNAFNLFFVGRNATVDAVRELLDERVPKLKQAGVYPLAYLYGFDEVNDEVFPRMREVFGMVGKHYPGLPRMTTGYDNTFGRKTGLREYVDIWVPLIPEYDMVEADRLRAEGKDMWWYLCVGPRHPYPNWFVESPAIEARLLMGAMSYKYQVGGVLYFMTNQWQHNDRPITAGPYTDWFPGAGKSRESVHANGDGHIFCAGPDGPLTTIRYENIRDGLEDYEYLYQLARTVDSVAQLPPSMARAEFLHNARQLLAVPDDVVESSSRYTLDPARFYDFRTRLAQAILTGRALAK